MTYSRLLAAALIPALLLLPACSAKRESIPTHPLADPEATLTLMRDRAARLTRATGHGDVTLTDPAGRAVTLDAVYVLQPPDRVRLRCWKFDRAVLDLTLLPGEAWLFAPREQGSPGRVTAAAPTLSAALRNILAAARGDLTGTPRIEGNDLLILQPLGDGNSLETRVDRPTLTVRSVVLRDPAGVPRLSLDLSRYAAFGPPDAPVLWPRLIRAVSPDGVITFETTRFDPGVAADTAFTPPPRATRLP